MSKGDKNNLVIDLPPQPQGNRHCGGCTLCCKLLPVRELDKRAGERCRHQGGGHCRVYRRPQMPFSCVVWSCRWLVDPATAKLKRPDRTHYVIDMMPDLVRLTDNVTGAAQEIEVVQVWCDPAFPDAWRDPALFAYAEQQAEAGIAMLVRYDSSRAIAVFAPAFDVERQWHFIEHTTTLGSPTGNRMLDMVVAARGAPDTEK